MDSLPGVHAAGMREQLPHLGNAGMGDGRPSPLKAPFPWFGGKSRIASVVWERFGDVANYVEPFAGSLAVLLARPHAPRIETVNDLDCYLANFWRAAATDPEAVAAACDWPVNEADLHARHRWLVSRADFRERMRRDPEYFDAKIAGWWVWGLCAWIGGGWCSLDPDEHEANAGKRPEIGAGTGGASRPHYGKGVHALGQRLPMLGGSGDDARGNAHPGRGVHAAAMRRDVHEKLPDMDSSGIHTAAVRSALYETFEAISARLRYVRVACGDWSRVVTDSVTWRHGTTALFLDPPYSTSERAEGLYAQDSGTVAADVRAWCLEHGGDKRLRIALCGYAGEGHEVLEGEGWDVVAWKAKGGYGGQRKAKGADGSETNENAHRERIWFSPGCLRGDGPLFEPRGAR